MTDILLEIADSSSPRIFEAVTRMASQDYNSIASDYRAYIENAITEWTVGYPNVIRLIQPLVGKRILDFGCGSGEFAAHLAELGGIFSGVDISDEMIQIARQRYGGIVTFLMPYEERGMFDACVVNFVLCTMEGAEKIREALNDIYTKLKPGGICVAINDNWELSNGRKFASFELEQSEELRSGCMVRVLLRSGPLTEVRDYFWSRSDYIDFFEAAGFCNVRAANTLCDRALSHPQWRDEYNYPAFLTVIGERL